MAVVLLAVGVSGISQKDALFYLVPLGLILLILALFFDTFGLFCLVLAWLPFSRGILQFEIGIVTVNPYMLGMMGLALIVLGKILRGWRYGFNGVDKVIVLICLTFLVSTLLSDSLLGSGYLAVHSIFVPFVSYFVVRGMVTTEKQYHQAQVFFLGGLTVFGAFSVYQFLATHERVSILEMPFIDVGTFAIAAAVLLIFSRWWRSPSGIMATLIALVTLIASLSRMYLASFLLGKWLFGLISRGKSKLLVILMLAIFFLGTLLLSFNPEVFRPAKFDKAAEYSTERITSIDFWKWSIYGRALAYRDGLNAFFEHPLFGVGLRPGNVGLYQGQGMVTRHNFIVEWLEYGGIVGMMLYSALLIFHFKSMEKLATSDRFIAANLLIIFIIMCNSITNGFMHGMMPYVAILLMGFNEARFRLIKLKVATTI